MPTELDRPSLQTRRVRVHGRVQGVGYRQACMRHAQHLGVTGWVRNRVDGTVEALVQGSADQLDRMCACMRDEVPTAEVRRLDVETEAAPTEHLEGFEQRPTS